jgi:hypothetical protein
MPSSIGGGGLREKDDALVVREGQGEHGRHAQGQLESEAGDPVLGVFRRRGLKYTGIPNQQATVSFFENK